MPAKPPANLTHVWRTAGIDPEHALAKQKNNFASLRRKITYCKARPSEPLHYQCVEGWSAQQVIDCMLSAGISKARINKDFFANEGMGLLE